MSYPITLHLDDTNRDVLWVRRVELFLGADDIVEPDSKVVFHTEWRHLSGDLPRARTLGPRVERRLADVLPPDAIDELLGAFVTAAEADLGLGGDSENSDP